MTHSNRYRSKMKPINVIKSTYQQKKSLPTLLSTISFHAAHFFFSLFLVFFRISCNLRIWQYIWYFKHCVPRMILPLSQHYLNLCRLVGRSKDRSKLVALALFFCREKSFTDAKSIWIISLSVQASVRKKKQKNREKKSREIVTKSPFTHLISFIEGAHTFTCRFFDSRRARSMDLPHLL